MDPAVFALFSLAVTSAMLSVILAIAWASFGRPRHALTWSISYALGAADFLTSLLGNGDALENGPWRAVIVVLATLTATVMTIGFRQRIGIGSAAPLLAAGGGLLLICATAARLAPGTAWDRAPMLLYMALMLVVAATTLVGRGRQANAAEKASFAALCVFALFNLAVAVLAFQQGTVATPGETMVLRTVLLLGTPTVYTAVGLFSVFLLAADLAKQMRRLAIMDPLTGILNRRGLEQSAAAAIANSQRAGLPLAVVIADLDRFKQINDTHGHAVGDEALQRFARHVEGAIRKGDLFGRLGGEEFALVLSNTSAASAMEVTERIRAGIERIGAAVDGGPALTSSFGVAGLAAGDVAFDDPLLRADVALYRAKLAGRNRVMMADDPPPRVPSAGSAARQATPPPPAPPRSPRPPAPPPAPGAA